MKKIKAGIIGGAGYTAGELIRILLHHQHVHLTFVHSTNFAGKPVCTIHTDLTGDTDLVFASETEPVDVLFLCLGHGLSRDFLKNTQLPSHTKIIDLGNDFRVDTQFEQRQFIYGLTDLNLQEIKKANYIANPGCFATAIQLALLPMAAKNLLPSEIHINAITGSTGAGRGLSETSHFSYRQNNVAIYKPFTHQHLGEINKTLSTLQNNLPTLRFIPVRGAFTRGIFATLYFTSDKTVDSIQKIYRQFYETSPFTHVVNQNINLKDVINTNKCLLSIEKHDDLVLITSCIDNLVKGASGQAVENLNLMFDLPQAEGLALKSIGF